MAGLGARAKSITVTGVAGISGAFSMPLSFKVIRDDEMIKKIFSNSRQAKYWLGKESQGIQFTVADKEAFTKIRKGQKISSVVCVQEGAYDSTGVISTATALTATLTNGVVTEAVAAEFNTSGEPTEYTVTVMTHKNGGGTSTLVVT